LRLRQQAFKGERQIDHEQDHSLDIDLDD